MNARWLPQLQSVLLATALVSGSGCASLMSSATADLADSLTSAILDQNDPETVRQGAPAYLLLVDGMIADNPDSVELLSAGARLYSSYAGAFVDDPGRARRLAQRGRDYGWRAMCSSRQEACGSWSAPYPEFERIVDSMGKDQVPVLYVTGVAWATWISAASDDCAAVADKARVDAMMQRVVALDETYADGAAHLYLGILATLLPESMGGRPEEGRREFERALELSGGRNLMAKVLIAEKYARLVFDRDLHDRLCREVLEADPEAEGLTLVNTLAQERARDLLDESDEYFWE